MIGLEWFQWWDADGFPCCDYCDTGPIDHDWDTGWAMDADGLNYCPRCAAWVLIAGATGV